MTSIAPPTKTSADSDPTRSSVLDELIRNPPKLHHWGGEWHTGGFGSGILEILAQSCGSFGPGFRVIETGAGLSTLLFAASGAGAQICVAPNDDLRTRVMAEMEKRGLDPSNLEFVVSSSEESLPRLTENLTVDMALLDGGHGLPTVFVDFVYCNRALREGGTMIIDDLHLYSCAQLFLLLKSQPGWKLSTIYGKTAFFQKLSSARYLPDFGAQPFVMRNSVIDWG